MITINSISKAYGSLQVLDLKNITFNKGIYWIKGTNGSGKSTLLKVLAGLIPFKGNIVMNQKFSILKNPIQYRASINHAPAEPTYPSFLSGQELINFYMKVTNGTEEQVAQLKRSLGIDNYIQNPCGTYSSGMLKKLSLLLALMGSSDWIFLDEPFTTLDTNTQKALQDMIQNTIGKGFIITSHHDILQSDLSFSAIYQLKNKSLELEKHP